MKNARNTQKSEASVAVAAAPIFACGKLPKRQNTVTADVLSKLLSHERLTGLETVFGASTTRLAAVVEYLQRRYGWHIVTARRSHLAEARRVMVGSRQRCM